MTSTETTEAPTETVAARRGMTVAKAYPSVLKVAGEEERVPTVPIAVITEELTDVLRATATVLGYRLVPGTVDLAVVPAPVAEYGHHRVLVMLDGECEATGVPVPE